MKWVNVLWLIKSICRTIIGEKTWRPKCSGGDSELTSLLADSPPVDEEGLDGGGPQDQGEEGEEEAGQGHHQAAGGERGDVELRHRRVWNIQSSWTVRESPADHDKARTCLYVSWKYGLTAKLEEYRSAKMQKLFPHFNIPPIKSSIYWWFI